MPSQIHKGTEGQYSGQWANYQKARGQGNLAGEFKQGKRRGVASSK